MIHHRSSIHLFVIVFLLYVEKMIWHEMIRLTFSRGCMDGRRKTETLPDQLQQLSSGHKTSSVATEKGGGGGIVTVLLYQNAFGQLIQGMGGGGVLIKTTRENKIE